MLRTKLILWNSTILALMLCATAASLYLTSRAPLFHSVNSGLTRRAELFATQWHGVADAEKSAASNSLYDGPDVMGTVPPEEAHRLGIDPTQLQRFQATGEALRPMILTPDGEDALTSRKAWDRVGMRKAIEGEENFSDITYRGVSLRVLSRPLLEKGKVTAVMQLAVPLQWEQEQLSQLSRALGIVLPLAVVLMLAAGVVLTRRALRPFSDITKAVGAIEATNLDGRLPVIGDDEFARLSTTFNRMLNRIEDAFSQVEESLQRQKQFTSDASHELKTPLTAMRARAGVAFSHPADARELLEHISAMDRSTGLMIRIVQDLLFLAASDEGHLRLTKEPTSVRILVEDAVASVDLSNRLLDVQAGSEMRLNCDAAGITRVLVNLLQNSISHTAIGARIAITCASSVDFVTMTVSDAGVGIPAEHLSQVFQRFHRVDPSRQRTSGGSGLGLAIAKAIVEAHGGTIAIDSVVGKGTSVTVSIPI